MIYKDNIRELGYWFETITSKTYMTEGIPRTGARAKIPQTAPAVMSMKRCTDTVNALDQAL